MQALILEKPGRLQLADIAAPGKPGAGEALVRVRRVGICGTDLHAFEGKQPFLEYPRILGHELAVEVVATGDSTSGLQVGTRCAVEPYLNCGSCIACRREKPNCCANLQVIGVQADGGMRESLLVPIEKLHSSKRLSLDPLALVEPLSVAAHAVGRAGLQPGEAALVIGAGAIGLGVIECLRVAGARVLLLEISQKRLDFCRQLGRAEACFSAQGDVAGKLRRELSGDLPTVVFDCTGNPRSMMDSFGFVAHGGKLIFVGHFRGDVTFHDPLFHSREMTLLATRNATARDFRHVIAQLEDGVIDVTPWITHRVRPPALAQMLPQWLSPEAGAIKPIVEW